MDDEYTGTEAPTAADRTRFAAADEGKFYDILSDSDLKKLSRGVAIEAAEYNYGIIETHRYSHFLKSPQTPYHVTANGLRQWRHLADRSV
jgi:uncharacterized protein YqiB (DUF1249 family)